MHLEKQLHEEQLKNNQLYSKSIDLVNRYNHDIKALNDKQYFLRNSIEINKKDAQNMQIQSVNDNSQFLMPAKMLPADDKSDKLIKNELDNYLGPFKQQIFNIYSILNTTQFNSKTNINPNEMNSNALFFEIQSLAKSLSKLLNDFRCENKILKEQNEKLNNELKHCQESKLKLEALYKVKCKSDLNKAAQIKKCQLNYDMELMKFKNEFNCDLVRHLENQLSIKESLIFEKKLQIESFNHLINYLSEFQTNLNTQNKETNLSLIKQTIKNIIANFSTNEFKNFSISIPSNTGLNYINGTNISRNLNASFKRVPINVLFVKEDDNVQQQV